MIKTYETIPSQITAIKCNKKNNKKILEFCGNSAFYSYDTLNINTVEGWRTPNTGEYIIDYGKRYLDILTAKEFKKIYREIENDRE